eukprot:gnl/Carplike_NY0171/724_a998_1711.p1 GENE.gnl/Carplike_NY0171/724_a998_1711~~gnl/Carplike_NY0171/724_a998_1711.p1  ORF type:complete len:249 (+),score=87.63 gnl/Carplike_NY0171/724_a998_1711:89-835(+)
MSIESKFIKECELIESEPELFQPPISIKHKNSCQADIDSAKEEDVPAGSGGVQELLDGTGGAVFSSISIPFVKPYNISSIFICVGEVDGPKTLPIEFVTSNGDSVKKDYAICRPEHAFEWHELPVAVSNVVSCSIKCGELYSPDEEDNVVSIAAIRFLQKSIPEVEGEEKPVEIISEEEHEDKPQVEIISEDEEEMNPLAKTLEEEKRLRKLDREMEKEEFQKTCDDESPTKLKKKSFLSHFSSCTVV